MNAISRALKKGDPQAALHQPTATASVATLPKRKRGHASVDAAEAPAVAKQYSSVREGADIDLGMLDQEAFARVIEAGQQQPIQPPSVDQQLPKGPEEENEEDDGPDVADDVTYRPSAIGLEGADPIWGLRMTCLPALDIFSTEILKMLSSHQHSTILQIVTGNPASPLSLNYSTLLTLFDAMKKQLYSEETYQAFLDPDALNFKEMQERKVIRKANLATFISSVFGSVDVGFFHLNEGFLSTMAPDGGRLLKDMARLFLDLKTQAYISAMGQPTRNQDSILNDLFPSVTMLTHLFVSRRATSTPLRSTPTQDDLTPTEIEFIKKCERRRELLRSLGDGEKEVQELKETYSWENFLRELRAYIARNWESIVVSRGGKPRRVVKKRASMPTAGYIVDGSSVTTVVSTVQQGSPTSPQTQNQQPPQGIPSALPTVATTSQPIWEAYEKAKMSSMSSPSVAVGASSAGIPLPATPTPKSNAGAIRTVEGGQVRRPWTKEEEAALFAGLETVQGPNWAAILQLYGPGGSVSEALKDRSQVQLKDKARNLKLFFLKGGHDVPRVLERVTGRLKGDGHGNDETPPRRGKRRRTEDVTENTFASSPPSPPPAQESFTEAAWSQASEGQGQNYGMVEQNVDPGLQMTPG